MEIYIAQDINGKQTPELIIYGRTPFPVLETLQEAAGLHKQQGKGIAKMLFESLPGGTIDALLCEMLKKRASLLVVPFPKGK